MRLKYENVLVNIVKAKFWNSKKQKLLGVDIDRTLRFDEYITSLCRKAEGRLSVSASLSNLMCKNKKRVLIWMFHSRGANNKIKHLHERSLRIVNKDNIIKKALVFSKIYLKGISHLLLSSTNFT